MRGVGPTVRRTPAPEPAARLGSTSRLDGVEGLRALAAASVFAFHLWLFAGPDETRVSAGRLADAILSHAVLGLTLFFVLSGFLLYRPYVRAILEGGEWPIVRRYVRNRGLRILPAYVVILLLVTVVLPGGLIRAADGSLVLGSLIEHPDLLVRNLILVQNLFPSSVLTGIAPAWSLAVELVFYALLPMAAWVASRRLEGDAARSRSWRVAIAPAAFLAIGWTTKVALSVVLVPEVGVAPGWDPDTYSVVERSFLAHADLFAYGMLAAFVRVQHERGVLAATRVQWFAIGSGAVVLLGAVAAARTAGLVPYAVYQALAGVACGGIVSFVTLAEPAHGRSWRPLEVLESRPLVAFGLASYSFYLWHEPVIRLLAAQGVTATGLAGLAVQGVVHGAVATALAALTYRWVEVPALRRKRPMHPRRGARRERLRRGW